MFKQKFNQLSQSDTLYISRLINNLENEYKYDPLATEDTLETINN